MTASILCIHSPALELLIFPCILFCRRPFSDQFHSDCLQGTTGPVLLRLSCASCFLTRLALRSSSRANFSMLAECLQQ